MMNRSSQPATSWIAAAIVTAAIAAPLGYLAGRAMSPAGKDAGPARAQHAHAAPGGTPEVLIDARPLQGAVRAAIQEELRASRSLPGTAPAAAAAGPGTDPEEDPAQAAPGRSAPAPQSARARDEGLRLVDQARGRRSWSPQDADDLRQLVAQMNDVDRRRVLSQLLPAINRGEIVPQAPGFPL